MELHDFLWKIFEHFTALSGRPATHHRGQPGSGPELRLDSDARRPPRLDSAALGGGRGPPRVVRQIVEGEG